MEPYIQKGVVGKKYRGTSILFLCILSKSERLPSYSGTSCIYYDWYIMYLIFFHRGVVEIIRQGRRLFQGRRCPITVKLSNTTTNINGETVWVWAEEHELLLIFDGKHCKSAGWNRRHPDHNHRIKKDMTLLKDNSRDYLEYQDPIQILEVKQADTKPRKAPGFDNVHQEFLISSGP